MSATTAGISELLLVSYYLNLLFFHSQIWDYKLVITKNVYTILSKVFTHPYQSLNSAVPIIPMATGV